MVVGSIYLSHKRCYCCQYSIFTIIKTSLNCVISFENLEEPGKCFSKVFTWKMSCNQSSFLYYKTILTIFENRREYEEKKTEIVGNKAKGWISTRACVSGGKKWSFSGKFGVPYYRRDSHNQNPKNFIVTT